MKRSLFGVVLSGGGRTCEKAGSGGMPLYHQDRALEGGSCEAPAKCL